MIGMTLKSISLIAFLSLGFLSITPAWAQDADPIDEIISRGTIQQDPAMSAWNAGDYETAEIEFGKNVLCALRAERNFTSALEAARDSSATANIAAGAIVAPQVTGGQGGVSVIEAPPAPKAQINSLNFRKNQSATKRTCEDRGFQLYMKGMSQLKLGKRDEAKKTLKRAAKMRQNLFDAHFRLSLMEYQDGNIEAANKHFKKLRKLEPKCKACGARDEIIEQIKYLKNLLK